MMWRDAAGIRRAVGGREASAVEVCRASLERIEALNPALNAFITVDAEGTLARAADLDRRSAAAKDLPLLGVPIALKDNICTRGLRTTAGSQLVLPTTMAPAASRRSTTVALYGGT